MGGFMSPLPYRPDLGQIPRHDPQHGQSQVQAWHECAGDVCIIAYAHGIVERRELELLADAGLIRKSKSGSGRLLWEWMTQPVDLDVEALEAMLASDDGVDR
jgi:hypothetical protein